MSHYSLVFLFSGQGSQYYQMGQQLYQKYPPFRERLERTEAVWIKIGGVSILRDFYSSTNKIGDLCDDIRITHPLLFIIQYALAVAMIETQVLPAPAYLLGASLGEQVAAAVSGALTLEDSLRLIRLQTEAVYCHGEKGGMTAVLAAPTLYDESAFLQQRSTIAGFNHESHFVLSGSAKKMAQVNQWLKGNDVIFQKIDVAYGFHSPSLDVVKESFMHAEQSLYWAKPNYPLVSCARVEVINAFSGYSFWHVARNPIYFRKTIALLEKRGPFIYLDLGPSGTLATLVKYNLQADSRSAFSSLLTPYGTDLINLEKIQSLLR